MKILQVISSFPPAYAYGGPAKVAYEISKELVKRGHEVTVYTTDVLDAHSLKYDKNPMWVDGIEVYHFKNVSNKLAHRKNLAAAPGMAFALKKNIKNFDVIHLHEYRSFQAIFVHHYAKKYKVPYVLQPRGSVPTTIKGRQKKLFDALFGHAIVKDASKIIASSKVESNQYWDVYPDLKDEKIVHIPNGIDLSEYSNLPEKGEFRRKYSMGNNEKLILYLGRIHEIKGLDVLVRAFADLVKELDGVKLAIVGPDDGYISPLKEIVTNLKIDGKILFIGPLYERDKLKAYVDADIFTLSSRYESFGNVALEACAYGIPVIVTNRCGIAEWINNDAGIVVEYDKDKLRDAMLKILSDEELRRRLGEEGKKLVMREFSVDKIVRKMEELYEDCVHR